MYQYKMLIFFGMQADFQESELLITEENRKQAEHFASFEIDRNFCEEENQSDVDETASKLLVDSTLSDEEIAELLAGLMPSTEEVAAETPVVSNHQ